ncbi:unnamed protein product [Paramecium sonneborni]|uniref:Uncharacterized protein n=1 Tax=Paramecium sonneborni TaxID=65129 RepID=A0A8S1QRY8_9CILI|nr:unnamed protein product [Paramecium sonneborni]
MKRKYNKLFKTEVETDAFGDLETIQDFESKLKSFIDNSQKITKTKMKVQMKDQNSQNDLDFQAILLDKIIRKSMTKKDLKTKYIDVCQEFGIDYYQLFKLETLEQKQNYAIQCATKQISKSLENLFAKYKQEKHEPSIPNINKPLDLYGWMKVKSQYKKLKKILQYALIELVYQNSNQDKIKMFFAYINHFIQKRHKTTESLNFSTAHTSRVRTQQNFEEKLYLDPPKFQFSQPDLFFEWNQAIEQGYISNDNNIHKVGYEQMKKQNSKGVNYQKREKLLDQCQEGNYLTADELKFLASTSFLINKCLDKQFIQRAINFLDSSVIHQIEMNIAEQILQTFYYMKRNLIQYRKEWLEKINKEKRKNIKINYELNQKKNQLLSNSNQIRNIKKKIINQLRDVAKKKQLQNEAERKKEKYLRVQRRMGNPLANIYVQKFKEIVLQVISKIREKKVSDKERQKEFLQRNEAKPPPKAIYKIGNEIYDVSKSKRAFHPPSKVMTTLSEDKYKVQKPEIQKQEIKRYKLGIRNYTVTQDQFKNYYAGGPQLPRQFQSPELQYLNKNDESDTNFPRKNNWITSEAEVQAANKIKFAIKRYIQKKALNKLIVRSEVKKNRDIEMKIRKCMQAKKFFEELHKELDKRQSERLKDISSHLPPKLPIDKIEKIPSQGALSIGVKSSGQISQTQRTTKRLQSHRLSLYKYIPTQEKVDENSLDTARRAELEIKEIARKKKMMKFSKQKEMSEAKLKNRKLIVAAKMKNLQVAMTSGFQYNQRDTQLCDRFGNTPLYYCAKNGDEQFCRFLLNLGANVNQQCENLNTPLHMAFQSESKQIIIDFINKGGNLNMVNADKWTPLAFGSEELLKSLNLCNLVATTQFKNLESDNNNVFSKKEPRWIDQQFEDTLVYDRYKYKTII